MSSAQLNALVRNIGETRRLLLPSKFDSTGSYADAARVSARAAAFRVLAHAEIESYFEDRVIEVAQTAWQSWKTKQHVSRVALCLLGFSGREMKLPPETISPPHNKKQSDWMALIDLRARLGDCVQQFVSGIRRNNHGIKEKNILSMLLPIGFDHKKCDPVFLTTMNQFGEQRGLVVHSSRSMYITQFVDPKAESDRVKSILVELNTIDRELDALLQEATS